MSISDDVAKQPSHTYRYAVFGRRTSGKTVFLASLGAARREPASGALISYADTLLPIERLSYKGKKKPTVADLEIERQENKIRYAASVKALQTQGLPDATDPKWGFARYKFKIDLPADQAKGFTSGRFYFIELIDYAGELLDQHTEEKELASQLRQMLRGMDGLLIFAEVPEKVSGNVKLDNIHFNELNNLNQALSQLIAEDNDRQLKYGRLALLATKWDRQSHFDFSDVTVPTRDERKRRELVIERSEELNFRKWLDTDPRASGHSQLESGLVNTVGRENIRSFPVSALGQVDPNSDDEVAPLGPLQVLNVIEPFEFLIERANALDLQRMEISAEKLSRVSQQLKFFSPLVRKAIIPSSVEMAQRFEGNSSILEKIEGVKNIRSRTIRNRFASLITISVAVFFGGVTAYDGYQITELKKVEQTFTLQGFDKMSPWLKGYTSGAYPIPRVVSHQFLLSPEQAEERLDNLKIRIDETYGAVILNEYALAENTRKSAEEYLSKVVGNDESISDGEIAKRAREIQNINKDLSLIENWWSNVSSKVSALDGESVASGCRTDSTSSDNIDSALQEVVNAPPPLRDAPEYLKPYWRGAKKRLATYDESIKAAQNCRNILYVAEVRKEVDDSFAGYDFSFGFSTLAEALDNVGDDAPLLSKIKQIAKSHLLSLSDSIGRYTEEQSRNNSYDPYPKVFQKLDAALSDPNLIKLMAFQPKETKSAQEALRAGIHSIRNSWECDRYRKIAPLLELYDPFIPNRSIGKLVADYQHEGHSQQRMSDVRLVESYLSKASEPAEIKLTMVKFTAVEGGRSALFDYNSSKFSWSVTVNGTQEFSGDKKVSHTKNTPVLFKDGYAPVLKIARVDGSLTFNVHIHSEKNYLSQAHDYTSEEVTRSSAQMRDSLIEITLEDNHDDIFKTKHYGKLIIRAEIAEIKKPDIASVECGK